MEFFMLIITIHQNNNILKYYSKHFNIIETIIDWSFPCYFAVTTTYLVPHCLPQIQFITHPHSTPQYSAVTHFNSGNGSLEPQPPVPDHVLAAPVSAESAFFAAIRRGRPPTTPPPLALPLPTLPPRRLESPRPPAARERSTPAALDDSQARAAVPPGAEGGGGRGSATGSDSDAPAVSALRQTRTERWGGMTQRERRGEMSRTAR